MQASESHYCEPRTDAGPWTAVELGFPSAPEDDLLPHADDPTDPTGTVYGCVPLDAVARIVESHGGLVDPTDDSRDDWNPGDLAVTLPAAARIPVLTEGSDSSTDPLVLMHGGAGWRGPTLPAGRSVLVTGRRGPLVAVLCGPVAGYVHHSWLTRPTP